MGDACGAAEVAEAPAHTWSVSLARRTPTRSAVVLVGGIVGCAVIGILYGSGGYGVLSALVLFGSTATYWIPRRYSLSSDALEVAYFGRLRPMRYGWAQFATCVAYGDAVFLGRSSRPSRLARYRGLTVFLSCEDPAIVAYIEERIRPGSSEPETD